MKKFILSCLALMMYTAGKAQTANVQGATQHTIETCQLVYSEDIEMMVSKDASAFGCGEILVMNLPPVTQTYTPFAVDFTVKGHYTFKKDTSLELPADHKVYFEDNLTGQVFDLVNSDSFTFMVNRSIPKRFILRMEKQTKLYAKTNR